MKIQDAYNLWSTEYETTANKTRDLEKEVASYFYDKLKFSQVLELGSGTGLNTEMLLKKASHITALDFSVKMMSLAEQKFTKEPVRFIQADLNEQWPISETFDLVSSSLVLEHIENLTFIFQSVFKALEKGGHFYVCEYHPYKQYHGGKARFQMDEKTVFIDSYVHHLTEYIDEAKEAGFVVSESREWFDDDNTGVPRLISFLFQKL